MRQTIYTKNAPEPIGPYSQGVRAGNLIFFSGQIAIDPATGAMKGTTVEEQTTQVMENIKALMTAAGIDFSNAVKSMNDFPKVNEIYGSYFPKDQYPARETVEVSRLPKDALVEISVTCMAK